MDWMNDSDWNATARFEGPQGVEQFDAHLRGYADSVRVEAVPGPQGTEMLVLFRAEAGYTGAAVRLRDLVRLARKHCPDLLTAEEERPEADDADA